MLRLPSAAVAAFTIVLPTSAFAELSPSAYLAELEQLYALQGLAFVYDEVRESGDGLVVDGLTIGLEMPGVTMAMSMGAMSIRPTVTPGFDLEVETAPEMSGVMTAVDGFGEEMAVEITVGLRGMYWVGGSGAPRKLEMAYPEVALTYKMEPEGSEGPTVDVAASLRDVAGEFSYDLAAKTQDYQVQASTMTADLSIAEPEGTAAEVALSYYDVAVGGRGPLVDVANTAAAFAETDVTEMALKSAESTTKITVTEDGSPVVVDIKTGPGELATSIGRGGVDYLITNEAIEMNVSGAAIPLPPVTATMERLVSRIAMPMVPQEDMGLMALGLRAEGLEVSDVLWGMIDPGEALPRDPATLIVEAEAEARALMDFTNPQVEPVLGAPWEFGAIEISEIRASVAGAEVTASGSGEMNLDGLFPVPVGAIDVQLVGVTGLIAKLNEIGVLAPEQTMPVQMMLGMFAKPTGEPDSFESRIEAGPDGSIIANGIPLQ